MKILQIKKILIVFIAFLAVIIAAGAVFLLTFDINRYRGLIEEKISSAAGKDIKLGKMSLNLSHGLGCTVQDIILKEKAAAWDSAWLSAKKAEVSIRILPLLKKDVQLDRIQIDELNLKIGEEIIGTKGQASDSSGTKSNIGPETLGAIKFLANQVIINDSVISYAPSKNAAPLRVYISNLSLNNVSLYGPVRVNAVFSIPDKGNDNIILKGIVFPELKTNSPYLKDLYVKIDIDKIDVAGILAAFGREEASLFQGRHLSGIATLNAKKIFLDPNKILDSDFSVNLERFSADISEIPGGIKELGLSASFGSGDVSITKFSGLLAGSRVSAAGTVKGLADFVKNKKFPELRDFNCQMALAGIDVQKLLRLLGKPEVAEMAQGKTFKGNIVLNAKSLSLSPSDIFMSDVSISASGLSTDIVAGDKGGIKDVNFEARLSQGNISIEKFSGKVAGGDVLASGKIKDIQSLVSGETGLQAEGVLIQFNLEDFDIPGLIAVSGNMTASDALKGKKIAGRVTVKSDKLSMSGKQELAGLSVMISQGSTDMVPIQGGVRDIEIDVALNGKDIELRRFTGFASGGSFSISGTVKDIFSRQLSKLSISCKGIELDNVVPKTEPGYPRFQGLLDMSSDFEAQGLQIEALIKNLSGSGSAKISGPVLKGLNILSTAFSKIDMIPGLVAKLKENLPQNYLDVLNKSDTQFKPIEASYTISQGNVTFKGLSVESDGFIVISSGSVGFLGDVKLDSQLFILPDLSKAFVGIVKELRYLQDQEGMINMPLFIVGKAPQVSVDIDRQYLLNKLLISKGTELLGDLLSGKKGSGQETQIQPDSQQQNAVQTDNQQGEEKAPEPASIFKSIFDAIGSQK